MDLETYSRTHPQLLASSLPPLLAVATAAGSGHVVDLGCGEGSNVQGLLDNNLVERITAVDLSDLRIKQVQKLDPRVTGIVSDACAVTQLPDACADGVIVSQVIEHVPDPAALLAEVARLAKPGAWWYIGSVARADKAWWLYKVDGVRRLDPTHVREYKSLPDFLNHLQNPDLTLTKSRSAKVSYSLGDMAILATSKAYRQRPEQLPKAVQRLRSLPGRIHPPGFTIVEAVGTRN